MTGLHGRKLLVIITEAALEQSLAADVLRLGAQGYTVADVRGSGLHGPRAGGFDGDRNIEMKVICSAEVARRILDHVQEAYLAHYSLSLFTTDAQVLRPDKFK